MATVKESLIVAKREHDLAVRALGRSLRVQPGTKTADKHRADFERHEERFEDAIKRAIDAQDDQ